MKSQKNQSLPTNSFSTPSSLSIKSNHKVSTTDTRIVQPKRNGISTNTPKPKKPAPQSFVELHQNAIEAAAEAIAVAMGCDPEEMDSVARGGAMSTARAAIAAYETVMVGKPWSDA